MANVKWTQDQLNAIELRPQKMLVSAAAGSGKTAVLTERILRRLKTDPKADVTGFLVVTYTKLAAAELRSRIGKSLREAATESDGELSRRLSKQCNRLGSAHISTIHSYCAALVKRHFLELELPPTLKVCEEAQALEIKERLMDELIEHAYEGKFEPIPNFEDFANNFVTVGDKALVEKMLKLYSTVSGIPEGLEKWESSARLLLSDTPFLLTPWGELTVKEYCRTLRFYELHYLRIMDIVRYDEGCEKYYTHLKKELEQIRNLYSALENRNAAEVRAALSAFQFEKIPYVKTDGTVTERKEFQGSIRDKLRDVFLKEKIKKDILFSDLDSANSEDSAEVKLMRRKSAEISLALVALLSEFNKMYTNEKKRLGILDFADLEQYTYRLLYGADGKPNQLARQVSSSFDEIFVDEFQDVNPMQSKIFDALSVCCAIFQVGDIKQSIYSFRGAEPNIFAECRRSYTALDHEKPDTANAKEMTVFLSANFRSMYPVTAFVNRIFDPMFYNPDGYISKNDRIPYTDGDKLICKRKDAYEDEECTVLKNNTSPVKISLIELPPKPRAKKGEAPPPEDPTRLTDTEAECYAVALKIEELIKSGVKGKDIAIVSRAAGHVAMVEEMLLKRGITSANDKGAHLADMPEIQLALSILSCVDNPHRDIELAGALRSPIFNFTFDELITVRRYKKGTSLFSALKAYTSEQGCEKGARFIGFIEKMRAYSAGQPASRVLWEIYVNTDFFSRIYDCGKASPVLAAARRANLIKLHSLASERENVGRDGIYTFLRRFERLSATTNAPTASSVNDENTVRFFTAHGSKGLEFPHCFVCGLGHSPRKSQQRDFTADAICDNELGIAVKLRDNTSIARVDTPIRKAIESKIKFTLFEEDLRVLYVELTRARDNLYVSATVDSYEKLMEKTALAAKLNDPSAYLRLESPIEWIFTALQTERNGSVFLPAEQLQIEKIPELELRARKNAENSEKTAATEGKQKQITADLELRDKLIARINTEYPYKLSATIPAKISVSRLYPELLDEDTKAFDPLYEAISAAQKSPPVSASSEEAETETEPPSLDITKDKNTSRSGNMPQKLKTPLFVLGAGLTGIREKLTAEATEEGEADIIKGSILYNSLKYNSPECDLDALAQTASAAERGTATHLFMQFCDLENAEKNGIEAEIERLCDMQFIMPYHKKLIDPNAIHRFINSETYKEMKRSSHLRREVRFNTRLPAAMFTADRAKKTALKNDTILVQGVIDCYYVTDNGKTVLLDYKTDAFPEDMSERAVAATLRKRHSTQLYYYKIALERLLLRPVDRVEIFSFAIGKTISLRFKK